MGCPKDETAPNSLFGKGRDGSVPMHKEEKSGNWKEGQEVDKYCRCQMPNNPSQLMISCDD